MNLDIHQQNAVDDIHGVISVIAGPGAGKTRVLIERTSKILSSGTTEIYTANQDIFINKLSVVNWSSSVAIINIYKYVAGEYIGIIPKNKELNAGSAIILIEGIALKTGMGIYVNTDQVTHVDLNSN